MSMFDLQKKTVTFIGTALFMVIGTYNAVVINSESSISSADMKFVKRLDELYGVTEYARGAASATHWQKLAPVNQVVKTSVSALKSKRGLPSVANKKRTLEEAAPVVTAAVQDSLELNLVEVINSKKWVNGLKDTQFTGSLSTNNGVIESLSVSLPDGAGVSVSFSEMNGNVFEYDMEGQVYSGMMYQVDTSSYMVTLTNGPMEGTRLRFLGAPSVEQEQANQQAVAEADTKDERNYGNDGTDTAKPEEVAVAEPAQNIEQAYNRDLDIQQASQAAAEQAALKGLQAQEAPVEGQEQQPGYFEQLQNQMPEQAQAETSPATQGQG